MSQASKYYRIQHIDSQLDQIKNRVAEIDLLLKDKSELERITTQLNDLEDRLQAEYKTLKRTEDAVKSQLSKIELTESSLYGGKVRNPKELQDLQHESEALKRHLSTLEDQQLEIMMIIEETEKEVKEAKNQILQAQALYSEKSALLLGEQTELRSKLSNLELERQAATSGIPAAELDFYNKLRLQRNGVAVSSIIEKNCSACGSTLTAALIQSAQSPYQIARCTFCGRILYPG